MTSSTASPNSSHEFRDGRAAQHGCRATPEVGPRPGFDRSGGGQPSAPLLPAYLGATATRGAPAPSSTPTASRTRLAWLGAAGSGWQQRTRPANSVARIGSIRKASDVTLTVSRGTPGTQQGDWGTALQWKGPGWGDLGHGGTRGPSA